MAITWKTVWVEIDDAVIDGNDPIAVIAPLWWEVDISNSLEVLDKTSARFTDPQKHVHAISWYNAEVNNGGHCQFFTNPTGIVWKRALDGFNAAGMYEYADVLRNCLQTFGGALPFNRSEREDLVDKSGLDFQVDDDAFFALGETRLNAELMRYVQKHREEFKCEGEIQQPVGIP